MTEDQLRQHYKNCNKILEQINVVMWNSFHLKDREFGREQGAMIAELLEKWCERESEIDAM
jgi:hypothetical protein